MQRFISNSMDDKRILASEKEEIKEESRVKIEQLFELLRISPRKRKQNDSGLSSNLRALKKLLAAFENAKSLKQLIDQHGNALASLAANHGNTNTLNLLHAYGFEIPWPEEKKPSALELPPRLKEIDDLENSIVQMVNEQRLDQIEPKLKDLFIKLEKLNACCDNLFLKYYAIYFLHVLIVKDKLDENELLAMEALLEENPTVLNAQSVYGHSLIQLAARYGHTAALEVMMNYSTHVTKKNLQYDLMENAIARSCSETLAMLIDKNKEEWDSENESWFSLMEKSINNNLNCLKILVKKAPGQLNKCNSWGKTLLHSAAKNGRTDVLKFLMTQKPELLHALDSEDNTAMHLAAQGGHIESIELLIELTPEHLNFQNQQHESPLHLAVKAGHFPVVELLIKKDPQELSIKNKHGFTPVELAILSKTPITLEVILKYASSVLNDSFQLAQFAASKNKIESLKQIIDADPKVLKKLGDSVTKESYSIDILKLLYVYGVNVEWPEGKKPAAVEIPPRLSEIIDLEKDISIRIVSRDLTALEMTKTNSVANLKIMENIFATKQRLIHYFYRVLDDKIEKLNDCCDSVFRELVDTPLINFHVAISRHDSKKALQAAQTIPFYVNKSQLEIASEASSVTEDMLAQQYNKFLDRYHEVRKYFLPANSTMFATAAPQQLADYDNLLAQYNVKNPAPIQIIAQIILGLHDLAKEVTKTVPKDTGLTAALNTMKVEFLDRDRGSGLTYRKN